MIDWGLPWRLCGKESACQCGKHSFDPLSGKNLHTTEPRSLCVRGCLTGELLCAVSHLSWALCSLSVPIRGERSWQAAPRTEKIIEMGCLHRISFISFSTWWKGVFTTLFWYGLPLALWPLLLLVSLVTCKVRSFDLYLKKLPCNTVYILLQNSIKHPCSTRDLGPHVLSLSLSSWFPGAQRPAA